MTTGSQGRSFADGPTLPEGPADAVDPVEETVEAVGLVQLGSDDGVVCEDGVCSVPPAFS